MNDRHWMSVAIEEAKRAADEGEVPVGAVVIRGSEEIGRAHNRRENDKSPLAHAELLAIEQAAHSVGDWRLTECTLFVTLEPCAMCAGALVNSRVKRLVFATEDPKAGYCGSLGDLVRDPRLNHRLEVCSGVLRDQSADLLKKFFAALRR